MVADLGREKAAKELLRRRKARTSMLAFLQYVWWENAPLVVGRHTRRLCAELDRAVERYLQGKSTNLLVQIPFRHGKSTVSSVAFPAYFIGRMIEHDPSLIQTGYASDLCEDFSRLVKKIIRSPEYQTLFPAVQIQRGEDSVKKWSLEGSSGACHYAGLDGGMTGKGGSLLICDDYLKNRKEAMSKQVLEGRWRGFNTDFRTRHAPVYICIVVATPWAKKDIAGRIKEEMKKNPDFPRYRVVRFPARRKKRDENGDFILNEDGSPVYEYLFPERFSDDWYKGHYASLGTMAAGLMDCSPTLEGGERFQIENIKEVPLSEFPKGARRVRGWDLASSKAEDSTDPDYTVGSKITVEPIPESNRFKIWVWDVDAFRLDATERNERIAAIIRADVKAGDKVGAMEAFAAYKDTFNQMVRLIRDERLNYVLKESRQSGSKEAKCSDLEPCFAYGNVYAPMGADWLPIFKEQFGEFPFGDHDDIPDSVQVAYHECTGGRSLLIG